MFYCYLQNIFQLLYGEPLHSVTVAFEFFVEKSQKFSTAYVDIQFQILRARLKPVLTLKMVISCEGIILTRILDC